MRRRKWEKVDFGLLNKQTGEYFDAELRLTRQRKGGFMKLWQDVGWEKNLGELQGASLRVLFRLTNVAAWGNSVPGPAETAKVMGMQRSNASHAYSELAKAGFLCKEEGRYYLNPLFCWKGRDEQYESAVARLTSPRDRQITMTSSVAIEAHQRVMER